MNKFLKVIFSYVIVLLVLNFLYLIAVGGNLRDYTRKYFKFSNKAQYIILGDSHADKGWRALNDKAYYNFAFGSDNISDMVYKWNYIKKKSANTQNNTLVLSFDGHLISKYREDKNNNYINETISSPYINIFIPYYLPLFFDTNTNIDIENYFQSLFKNKGAADKQTLKKVDTAAFVLRFNSQFPAAGKSEILIEKYQQLINDARSNNYRLIGIRYPVHPYYHQLIAQDKNAAYLTGVMDSLAAVNKIKVIDFSPYIQATKYFENQDHVNQAGSLILIDLFKHLHLN